jgi:hypothetical protein
VAILIILIACVISAILYRAGGMGKEETAQPTWMPMWLRQSWCRDWLCPAVFLALILYFFRPAYLQDWISIPIYYGLTGGSMSTYWDFLFHEVDNYYMHGLVIGIAGFALITFVPWWLLLARCIICTIGMGWWSAKEDVDFREEFGRGVFFIL